MIIIKRPGKTTAPTGEARATPAPPPKPSNNVADAPVATASKPPAGAPPEPSASSPVGVEEPKRQRRDTRFQPGQSGNPKGRPKNSRSLAEELRRAMQKRVPGTDLNFQQLMTQQLTHQGGKGSLRAIELAAKLADQGSVNKVKQTLVSEPLPLDADAYRRIFETFRRGLGESDPKESK